ncbi:hypothetical protein [Phycicoccus jejuensis]|uniref:hypothetical protein n=1 Tax=Phycicoccus jejuensis TaxID=367299 RepID=UPI0004C3CB8F|nr:hypothetical protein [Phycicoccus jejuensis]
MTRHATETALAVGALPRPVRLAVAGAIGLGLLGAAVGLVLGLLAYPPTAWFAVLEVGAPSTVLGLVVGLLAGLVTRAPTGPG